MANRKIHLTPRHVGAGTARPAPRNAGLLDLVDGYLNSNTGLVETTDYYTMTSPNISDTQPGGVAGYVQGTKIQQGQSSAPALQRYQEYYAHPVGGMTVYPVADSRVYKTATTDPNDSSKEQTNYSYTWYGTGSG